MTYDRLPYAFHVLRCTNFKETLLKTGGKYIANNTAVRLVRLSIQSHSNIDTSQVTGHRSQMQVTALLINKRDKQFPLKLRLYWVGLGLQNSHF